MGEACVPWATLHLLRDRYLQSICHMLSAVLQIEVLSQPNGSV